jgi:hypothetical protein
MALISPIRVCCVCKEQKKAYSESLFANGLYGFYCQECDQKEDQ